MLIFGVIGLIIVLVLVLVVVGIFILSIGNEIDRMRTWKGHVNKNRN